MSIPPSKKVEDDGITAAVHVEHQVSALYEHGHEGPPVELWKVEHENCRQVDRKHAGDEGEEDAEEHDDHTTLSTNWRKLCA